jgi:hypothetical protein
LGWGEQKRDAFTRVNFQGNEGGNNHPPEWDQNNKQQDCEKERQPKLKEDRITSF